MDQQPPLQPFAPCHAPTVASWVHDAQSLFWLAPNSCAPLTPAKVVDWTRDRGTAYLLFEPNHGAPTGYAELNPMRNDPNHLWIGHVIIDPQRRGRQLGKALTKLLIVAAFSQPTVHRLTLVVFPENTKAVRCYEACGFGLCGSEYHRFKNWPGKKHEMLRFDLTPAQYAAQIDTNQLVYEPATKD